MNLWIRSLLFNVFFIVWTTICVLSGTPSFFGNRRYVFKAARLWGRGTNFLLKYLTHIDVEIRGLEHLKNGPHLIASKHQSVWETTMIESVMPDCAIILKRELTWIPLFGQLLLSSDMISINRKKGSKIIQQIVEGAKRCFAQGRSVWIFPEGTRRSPGAEPKYKYGIVALYEQLNVPVVPIALNSGCVWGRRQFLRKPGKIILEVFPPIAPGLEPKIFFELLKNSIEEKSNLLMKNAKDIL